MSPQSLNMIACALSRFVRVANPCVCISSHQFLVLFFFAVTISENHTNRSSLARCQIARRASTGRPRAARVLAVACHDQRPALISALVSAHVVLGRCSRSCAAGGEIRERGRQGARKSPQKGARVSVRVEECRRAVCDWRPRAAVLSV